MRRIRNIVLYGAIAACVYLVSRTVFFVLSYKGGWDRTFGLLLLFSEVHILVHSLGYILHVFKIKSTKQKPYLNAEIQEDAQPAVAVVVAARHEPREVLENTFLTLSVLDYKNKQITFLDDSSDEPFVSEARQIAEKFGVALYNREPRHGAKAGIINDYLKALAHSSIKYVAIFDADQNPMPAFLKRLVPILEADENLAFVQTPQAYTNADSSPIARGATIQQAIFYENICEGKDHSNAMFCSGTNVVFRKSALLDVGGFDESSITEDFATSILLHLKGYVSRYYGHVLAFGMAPESLVAYFKQQNRWSIGTINVFTKVIRLFFKGPNRLTIAQWWEYFLAGSYYFVGWAFFFMMLCPIVFLLLGIPSFVGRPEIYLAAFVPYFFLSMVVFYSTMLERHYRLKDVYYGTILGLVTFPILMRAAVFGIIGKRVPFAVTNKGKTGALTLPALWPWIAMITFNLSGVFSGAVTGWRLGGLSSAVGVNMFWATYHIFILSNVFYFNECSRRDWIRITGFVCAAALVLTTAIHWGLT